MHINHCEKNRRHGQLFELIRQESQAANTGKKTRNTRARVTTSADMERLLKAAQESLQASV
ncbi:hypothetical protein [uncultured Roseobacter sp.]|uniref:hypothetical protein n=1 Tax=uncultured Roseobacter sp. TaxID=114847 RepID=UPI00262FDB56|nr:hypothetical protein [uncultured Roseobacter sp.]